MLRIPRDIPVELDVLAEALGHENERLLYTRVVQGQMAHYRRGRRILASIDDYVESLERFERGNYKPDPAGQRRAVRASNAKGVDTDA